MSHLRPVPSASTRKLALRDITQAAGQLSIKLNALRSARPNLGWTLYGVPRGGVSAAFALALCDARYSFSDSPETADIVIDDLIDSGATAKRYAKFGKLFAALFWKLGIKPELSSLDLMHGSEVAKDTWLVFPWEDTDERASEDICQRLLQFIGEDPQREGLRETPARFSKAWRAWTEGYHADPKDILKSFEDGGEGYDQMLIQRDIPLYSHCEHHLAPFFGHAHIAYIPNGRIVGLSKLSRLVDIFAHRLQVQERLTSQIADALDSQLKPKGLGVVLECRHLCMESRGVQRIGTTTSTSALRGLLREGEARAEFFSLVKG